MKEITIRDFQLKASKHLKEMPLVLTRYGKPVAKITPYEEEAESLEYEQLKKETVDTPSPIESKKEKEEEVEKKEDIKQAIAESDQIEISKEDDEKYGLSVFQREFRACQEHYEPGVNYECYLTSFTNIDGNTMWTKWVCHGCFTQLYEKVKKHGGYLTPPKSK